ncbi:porin family protein [Psychrobacter lutiphocae]|uniref:porin family protein n=1 Tax=Psychrobacter lutiphocae TaxID=540500 RepID=UPI000361CDF3|nr:porin family protein [Psychrobacter lutiphocae]
MTHSFFLKKITASALLLSTAYIPLAYAVNLPTTTEPVSPESTINDFANIRDGAIDQATELERLERQNAVLDKTVPTARVTTEEIKDALDERRPEQQVQSYDLEALKADPVAFTRFLNLALAAQDMATVQALLPHYKSLQVNDPLLIKFADALVYRSQGKNKQAIAIYKDMLAENPDFHPVRLNMAQALYADKQYAAAEDQLQKLRGADIPEPVMASVTRLIDRIERQEKWQFNASVSYLYDKNLNDVPERPLTSQLGTTPRPESGKGLLVSASANKRINLSKNYYATVGGNALIKGYWDKSEYNDYLFTASTGVGYDDAKNDFSVTPFVTKRYYSEDPYSWRKGVTLKASRWVKPKLKLTATGIFSNETFDDSVNKNRETDGRFYGLNGLYIQDANQYFYGGIGYYENDVPKAKIISYDRNSVNVGWGREWSQGISTLTTLGYGVKKYENPAKDLSGGALLGYYNTFGGKPGSKRKDKTTSIGLQIWKRDFSVLGLTPRLVLDYDKTSSNFAYYDDRDDKTATIMLTKTF